MKTIIQIAAASTGGIGRITRDISSVLDKIGYENYICFGRGEVFNKHRDYKFGTKMNVYIDALKCRLFDNAGFNSQKSTERLIAFLTEKKPDIIQLHNLHGYYINIKILFEYIKKNHIPVAWTLHDCWALTGHCAYFEYLKCDNWQKGCYDCSAKNEYPVAYINNSDRNYKLKRNIFIGVENLKIITPSIWLSKIVKQSYLQNYPIITINNGIDLSIFRHKTHENNECIYKEKKVILGVASTWLERKGYHDFIKLSHLLPKEFQIVMVGLNKKQINEVRKENIIGINHTESAEELVNLYNEAHIFVNFTYDDNFPTVNLEAMACGTPVITYNTGGSPESITSETGYVITQHSIEKAKEIIIRHRKTDSTIKACLKQASKYDKNNIFQKYEALYSAILTDYGK